jgi:inorganic pyrophosphatase
MKTAFAQLAPFDVETGDLNVIIETPKGSRTKYSYDHKTGLFELSKMLPTGMIFPFDFGFIPSTCGDDGDPLDVLVISDAVLFPGCLVRAKLLGGLKAEQTKKNKTKRNDRLLAVPALVTMPGKSASSINDLDKKLLRDLQAFFISYNRLEGKEFKVLDILNAKKAKKTVQASQK